MASEIAAPSEQAPSGPVDSRPPAAAGHVVSAWAYVLVYFALLGLTALTAGVSFVDLGALNNVVAVGIALTKAALVVLVFMHVRWSPRLIPLAAIAGLFWLIHLMAGALSDYFTRGLLGVPGK